MSTMGYQPRNIQFHSDNARKEALMKSFNVNTWEECVRQLMGTHVSHRTIMVNGREIVVKVKRKFGVVAK